MKSESRARSEAPCAGCGQIYSAEAWAGLPAVQTLDDAEVRTHVVAWPTGRGVEVRACKRCGRRLARLTPPRGIARGQAP
jgi:hypothetical protein